MSKMLKYFVKKIKYTLPFFSRFDVFLVYVFCVKVFGCQTKAQLILERSIFLNVKSS